MQQLEQKNINQGAQVLVGGGDDEDPNIRLEPKKAPSINSSEDPKD